MSDHAPPESAPPAPTPPEPGPSGAGGGPGAPSAGGPAPGASTPVADVSAQVRATAATRAGQVRSVNQDAVYAGSAGGRPLLLVADGMGGHNTGEVASTHATEAVRAALEAARAHPPAALARALQSANRRVLTEARSDPRHEGMGTTMTAVLIDGEIGLIAHVGDTRAYLLRDGVLTPLTEDHSWVAERVRQGLLSEEEARRHRWRNVITNALGATDRFRLDLAHVRLREGDRLLIASDGLTSVLPEAVLHERLADGPPERAVEALLDAADERGSPDNVSAVVADVLHAPPTEKRYELPAAAPWTVEVGTRQTGIREVEERYPGRGPMTWMRKQPWYPYRLWIVGSAYLAFLLVLFVAMR